MRSLQVNFPCLLFSPGDNHFQHCWPISLIHGNDFDWGSTAPDSPPNSPSPHVQHLMFSFRIALCSGTSLVVQWWRICLPMQGTRVRALVWEDPTCCGATKPVRHSYWACALEPVSHNYWARMPQLLKPACLEPVLCNKRSHRNEKPAHHNEA